jgi:1,4-dihydroxy-2-naphthoyl-CoA hydrolase
MKTYSYTTAIRLHDVDAAGIVFFAQHLYLAHDVYEAFLNHIGHSIHGAIAEGNHIIPIKTCEVEFHRPMCHGEEITGELILTELRGSSFVTQIRFIGPENEPRSTIVMRHVCVKTATMKPMPLPEPLRAALSEYLKA